MINKKGQNMGVVVVIVIAIIFFLFSTTLLGKGKDVSKKGTKLVEGALEGTEDTDNDGTINTKDPCPCGTPDDKNENAVKKVGKVDYCYAPETPEECEELRLAGFDYKLLDDGSGYNDINFRCFYKKREDNTCPVLKKK